MAVALCAPFAYETPPEVHLDGGPFFGEGRHGAAVIWRILPYLFLKWFLTRGRWSLSRSPDPPPPPFRVPRARADRLRSRLGSSFFSSSFPWFLRSFDRLLMFCRTAWMMSWTFLVNSAHVPHVPVLVTRRRCSMIFSMIDFSIRPKAKAMSPSSLSYAFGKGLPASW